MQFYALNTHPDGEAETYVEKPDDCNRGDATSCPVCGRPVSMLTWLPPFRVTLKLYGKVFGDFAFMAGGNDFLVSQKFREVYHSLGLTGLLGFDLVEVIGIKSGRKRRQPPPTYFRVDVTYGQTALDMAASGFEWLETPTCPLCRTATIMRWKRLILEQETWTGEDAFRPRGMSGEIMVSERFKYACEQNGITNAFFMPAELSGHDFYPGASDPSELDRFRTPPSDS
jgi:hypothetical protein